MNPSSAAKSESHCGKQKSPIAGDVTTSLSLPENMDLMWKSMQGLGLRISPIFGLNDWTMPAPTYNIDILFAGINKSCTTHALGFYLKLPKASDLVTIGNISSLLQNNSGFMGVILRLSSFSATSGTIAVYKKRGIFKFFTHQFGESEVGPAVLREFFEKLSKTAGFMNYRHACFFEVVPFTPNFFRRTSSSNRDNASAYV